MTRLRRSMLALGFMVPLLGSAYCAFASETLTFAYDARGRLIQVARTGTVNNAIEANYAYDKGDNRTNVTVNGAAGAIYPAFSANDVSATEGGILVFTVAKSGSTSSSFSVSYATADGTAVAGSDYTAGNGTLTFAAADTTKTVSITTIDDTAVESAETLTLNLSAATGGATISDAQGIGTINDNDSATNQPPVANTDSASVQVCGTVSKNVIANDTDPEGNYPLQLTGIVSSTKGSATVESSTNVSYTAFGTTGTGVVKYTVSDSLGATATGTLNVTITSGICQ